MEGGVAHRERSPSVDSRHEHREDAPDASQSIHGNLESLGTS